MRAGFPHGQQRPIPRLTSVKLSILLIAQASLDEPLRSRPATVSGLASPFSRVIVDLYLCRAFDHTSSIPSTFNQYACSSASCCTRSAASTARCGFLPSARSIRRAHSEHSTYMRKRSVFAWASRFIACSHPRHSSSRFPFRVCDGDPHREPSHFTSTRPMLLAIMKGRALAPSPVSVAEINNGGHRKKTPLEARGRSSVNRRALAVR